MFVRLVLCVGVCCTYFFFYITSPEHPPSVGRHRKDNDDVAGRTCLHRGRRCDGELSTAAGCRIAIATPDKGLCTGKGHSVGFCKWAQRSHPCASMCCVVENVWAHGYVLGRSVCVPLRQAVMRWNETNLRRRRRLSDSGEWDAWLALLTGGD